MERLSPVLFAVCAAVAAIPLLGDAPDSTGSIYLRAPNLSVAPPVVSLDYDSVATVPAHPHTPAALLPVDHVVGTIVVTQADSTPSPTRPAYDGISTFTVVQVDGNGVVTERTVFTGVAITSISDLPTTDGSTTKRIRFEAAKVQVQTPKP